MTMPRPNDESKEFFASVIPVEPRVTVKPMFGNLASFMNGNMFAGLFGNQIFVRLPENDRLLLLEEDGAVEFSPMPGRKMKEYVVLPEQWRNHPDLVKEWLNKSLSWVETLPVKVPKKKKSKA
ncbi:MULTISPECIES: TfoX/Sxy family protein [unclassified Bacillus (in: firmicutes)]|uniref:TfoX/Sxy family protein n=1 Tax=unclassified Bacillus (in: firmicutes) TaxID=185979 RepID=UPI0008E745B9|nr:MULTISPECIES: TfoX/Sxy family protein [unclassified Bacillus (in: firmicutes)]SFA85995.1 Transcriptional regulator of competence genes, TfoX/Sxy family [Bacillus sp. UNCCL13]SFQ83561.1 Transcriptional regulator of competence genes, TfoX/Sxy family [Bacillus sp. cl95]